MAKGDKPDWDIRALDKDSQDKGLIGYGWNKPDGSIALSFNPFVTVPVGKRFAIQMFAQNRPITPNVAPAYPQARDLNLEDEIPF